MTPNRRPHPPNGSLTAARGSATPHHARRVVVELLLCAVLVAGALALIVGVAIGLDEPDDAWIGPARVYDALIALAW